MADRPSAEAMAAAPWSWRAKVDPKREIAAVVVMAGIGVAGGLFGGASPAVIAVMGAGAALFAVLILAWMRTHDAKTWAILHPDGRLEWHDPDQHGVIDLHATPAVHTLTVRRTVKGGNRRYHVTQRMLGPGDSPVLRGKDEGDPPTDRWAELSGFRLEAKHARSFVDLTEAAAAYTEVRPLDLVVTERVAPGPFGKAEVEGLPAGDAGD